jgi:hypothetical protein
MARRLGFFLCVGMVTIAGAPVSTADSTDGAAVAARLGTMFQRSMTHWKFSYHKMPDHKAGVACIPWERLDAAYLDTEIFKALGFSYSVAKDDLALRIADQGCNQMKSHYQLTDCECEAVLVGETVVVEVPDGFDANPR